MLTVKHINLAGAQAIYSAFSFEFRPAGYVVDGDSRPPHEMLDRVVALTEDRYVVAELHGGTVYVMNEQGKTVARYDIGAMGTLKQAA